MNMERKRNYSNKSQMLRTKQRKKQKVSMKSLAFVDDVYNLNYSSFMLEVTKLSNSGRSMNSEELIACTSDTDLFIENPSDVKVEEELSHNSCAKLSCVFEDKIKKQVEWPLDDTLYETDFLGYTTPLKSLVMQQSDKEDENEIPLTQPLHKKEKPDSNLFNDSVFHDVDLSLLEKNCLAETNISKKSMSNCEKLGSNISTNSNGFIGIHQPTDTKQVNSNDLQPCPVAASTPSSNKTSTSISTRLRKRLVENAHRSPLYPSKASTINKTESTNKSLVIESDSFFNKVDIDDLSTQDLGPFYGLPSKVKDLFEKLRGIKELYDWQHDCLTIKEVKTGKNFIYSLPTSGGKTLVAEILIFKTLLCQKKDALLILPFVAIVQEKIQSLSQFAVELGFLIEEYAGGKGRFPPRKRRKRNVLYIGTIEKANSLINSFVETGRLVELGLVVVDELHMIGEGGRRGATIETMLAKILYISDTTQIIGMSATLGNIEELATYLNAKIYTNDFRPVKLDEYVKVMSSLFKIDSTKLHPEDVFVKTKTMSYPTKDLAAKDTDHLASLVLEVIPAHSCLIFCPSKKNCENVAIMICKLLPSEFLDNHKIERKEILKALHSESGSVCPTLWKTIPYGIAYHHSGLVSDERRIIEEGYRAGFLSVITCTSTLAAGVNLPARRVIIRSPHIGRNFLSRAQYKQMIGRAGRAGIDTKGESFLIVSKLEDQPRVTDLVAGSVETCISSLMYDHGKGIKALLLNLIGLKIISSYADALQFLSRTLFSNQLERIKRRNPEILRNCVGETNDENTDEISVSDITRSSLEYLVNLKLVETMKSADEYKPTRLGTATFKGSIDLEISNSVYDELHHGLENLVLNSYLHLLYLITPYDSPASICPDWFVYMREMSRLTPSELSAAQLIGVPEQYIARRASGSNPKKMGVKGRVVSRFYVTLMLYELFKGRSVWDVSARFDQPRGFLQNLLASSAAFASCVLHFTKELEEFWPYHALLEKLIQVLQYCTIAELVPLMEIPSVKLARAKQLYKAGYKSLARIAAADPDMLFKDIEHLSRRQAQQLIASAKILLTEKIESLQEEVEELKHISA